MLEVVQELFDIGSRELAHELVLLIPQGLRQEHCRVHPLLGAQVLEQFGVKRWILVSSRHAKNGQVLQSLRRLVESALCRLACFTAVHKQKETSAHFEDTLGGFRVKRDHIGLGVLS